VLAHALVVNVEKEINVGVISAIKHDAFELMF